MTEADVLDRLSELARAERGALAALARAQGVSAEDAVDCVQEGLCTFLGRREQLPPDPAAWPALPFARRTRYEGAMYRRSATRALLLLALAVPAAEASAAHAVTIVGGDGGCPAPAAVGAALRVVLPDVVTSVDAGAEALRVE